SVSPASSSSPACCTACWSGSWARSVPLCPASAAERSQETGKPSLRAGLLLHDSRYGRAAFRRFWGILGRRFRGKSKLLGLTEQYPELPLRFRASLGLLLPVVSLLLQLVDTLAKELQLDGVAGVGIRHRLALGLCGVALFTRKD